MTTKILGAFDAVLDYAFTTLKRVAKFVLVIAAIGALYLLAIIALGYSIVIR